MTDYTTEEYHRAIREIAARLDDVKPNWRGEIDVKRLRLSQPDDCLFGQLYNNDALWLTHLRRLGLPARGTVYSWVTCDDAHIADWVQVIVER